MEVKIRSSSVTLFTGVGIIEGKFTFSLSRYFDLMVSPHLDILELTMVTFFKRLMGLGYIRNELLYKFK